MRTSKWPTFILIAYFVINILVILGLTKLCFFLDRGHVNMFDILPFALIVSTVLFLCQFFLFRVKVDIVDKRPVPKRKVTTASIFIALLMAVLTFTAFVLMLLVLFGENGGGSDESGLALVIALFLVFFGSWFFWAWGFLTLYKKNLPGDFMRKMVQRILFGSVLELIVAIPSHIIFRNRNDCCAPIASYFGIVMGTTVILLAFGPGIVFLFLKRMNDKKPKKGDTISS